MELPLNLLILRTVQEFGRVPISFLYSRLPASESEIKEQVEILARQGAIELRGDEVLRSKEKVGIKVT
ncbi:MAG: hypothetical protein ACHQRJ_02250 [Alphaproteobacteria bacterium]